MLDKNIFQQAIFIAKSLLDHGLSVELTSGSPIAPFLSALGNPSREMYEEYKDKGLLDEMIRLAYTTESIEDVNISAYDQLMLQTVEHYTPMLVKYIYLARTCVNSFARELASEATKQFIESNKTLDVGVQVTEAFFPDIMVNPNFREMVNIAAKENNQGINTDNNVLFPELPTDILRKLVFSLSGLAQDITAWLSTEQDKDKLAIAYNEVFVKRKYALLQSLADKDILIAAFLLASALLSNEVVDGVRGSLSEYTSLLQQIKSTAASRLYSYSLSLEKEAERGVVIRRVYDSSNLSTRSKAQRVVELNPISRQQYVKDGGEVSTIMGAAIDGRTTQTASQLLNNKDTYNEKFNSYLVGQSQQTNLQQTVNLRRILSGVFEGLLEKYSTGEYEGFGVPNATALSSFKKELPRVTADKISSFGEIDLYPICLKLVCDCKYPDLGVYKLLTDSMEIVKERDDLTAKDAVLLSLVNFVGDWLSDGLRVVDSK